MNAEAEFAAAQIAKWRTQAENARQSGKPDDAAWFDQAADLWQPWVDGIKS